MKLLLSGLLLVPSLAHTHCPEVARDSVEVPLHISVTAKDTTYEVRIGRNPAGFGSTWTASLFINDGTPGGTAPLGNMCGIPAVYDWYITMNDFRHYEFNYPAWYWVYCGTAPYPRGVRIGEENPVTTQVSPAEIKLTISSKLFPLYTPGSWMVRIHHIHKIHNVWTYTPAWTFRDTLPARHTTYPRTGIE